MTSNDKAAEQPPVLIGIGSSAGGLEALSQLFRALAAPDAPCDCSQLSFVVLQHLSPNHKSMMTEILGRETSLRVESFCDGGQPEGGVVYVVPSNSNACIRDGLFCLTEADPVIAPKPSINEFFISLATDRKDAAVGIVLSGTGSDGTAGLRAIQAAGGITMVQAPASAKYPGMPLSAIDAKVADFQLDPEAIAGRLQQIVPEVQQDITGLDQQRVRPLLELLHKERNLDFSGYKLGTVMRRIRRRIQATGHHNVDDYIAWVEHHPSEVDILTRDLLISVTAFFRDKEAFRALDEIALNVCRSKSKAEEIRVWVAGCATGEEAYSLAITFNEALRDRALTQPIQIFATDIDEDALNIARRGVYPAASLSAIPEAWQERYFQRKEQNLEVSHRLRDMIVFARHNLVDDPPFLRLDLITCRNVLIYFDHALQTRVLQRFHFALKDPGYLFLGHSEGISQAENLFDSLARRERLFVKKSASVLESKAPRKMADPVPESHKEDDRALLLLKATIENIGCTLALCDARGNVQYTLGDVARFFRFPAGNTKMQLREIIVESLQADVMALLHRLNKEKSPVRSFPKKLNNQLWQLDMFPVNGTTSRNIALTLTPLASDTLSGSRVNSADPEDALEMSRELSATREYLQSLIEDLATANEEMQSLNEEAQASNEELQASNEELEAANEELQATNEELISLNGELNKKTTEMVALNNEYTHLYDAIEFPILVFDAKLRLQRFNASASRRFNLKATAMRQSCQQLRFPDYLSDLSQTMESVMHQGQPEELSVKGDERSLQLTVTPGMSDHGQIESLIVTMVDVTDMLRTQSQLEASRSRLDTLMENTSLLMSIKDLSGRYLYVNPRFVELLNLTVSCQDKTDFELFPHDYAAGIWASDLEALRRGVAVESEHLLQVGESNRYFRCTHQVLSDGEGTPPIIINEAEEITQRKHADNQLKIAARVFEHSGEAIVVTDHTARILTINDAFSRITGYNTDEALGQNIGSLLSSGRHSESFYQQLWHQLEHKGYWQGEIWNRRKNREIFPEWLSINRVRSDNRADDDVFVAVFSDITNLKDSQRQAEFLASHDTLTRLPNRTLFQERLHYALSQARKHQSKVALLFLDLDNFKVVNDTLGHDVGDELLVQAAGRLRRVVRDVDTVARLGGDEFTIILPGYSVAETERLTHQVLDELALHFSIFDRKVYASASIGAAFYPDDAEDANGLLKAADTAMYRAKDSGRNRLQMFRPEHRVTLLKEAAIENALREALIREELTLAFQPQFDARDTGSIVGAEVLVRWHDAILGPVSPGEFIPIAEKSGLISDISRYVEDKTLAYLQQWQARGLLLPKISINTSAYSFREKDYIGQLKAKLEEHALSQNAVQIEITEGTLFNSNGALEETISQMRTAGIDFSIDDFGTGYSSLNYLKKLPIAELKIDKSFVDGLGQESHDEEIARAILSLAKALHMRTVAEGVETASQLAWLQAEGCDVIQGYLLSKPILPEAFAHCLETVPVRDFRNRTPCNIK